MNTYMVDTAINIAINQASQKQTMSSREIATLCSKEHSNVLRDIRVMLINLYGEDYVKENIPEQYRNRHSEYIRENADHILSAITGHSNWNDEQNQTFRGYKWQRDNRGYITEICLDKDHTLTLISGYNAKLRMAIIKRWQELEEANTVKDPMLLIAQMASLAYENNQRVLRNEKRLNQIEDKVNITIAKTNAILDDDNYFSVKGFCSYYNIKITSNQMSVLSKKCKKLSEIKEIDYREITDPRWGKVKIYHKDILLEVFRLNQLI